MRSAALQESELNSGEPSYLFPEGTQDEERGLTSDGKNDSDLLDLDIVQIQSSATTPTRSSQKLPDNPLIMAHRYHDAKDTSTLRSTGSTVMQLPPELLSKIFMHSRGVKETAVTLPPNNSSQFPWALIQVCSYWRQVLWGMVGVWSAIKIPSTLSQRKQEILPSVVQQVFDLANTFVSLEVHPLLELGTFTSVISPYPGRFQSLRLTLSFDLLGIFLNLPLDFFISLKTLEITIVRAPLVRPAMTHQTDALRKASYLDTFSIFYPYQIKRLGPIYALSGLWLPWSQLTFFKCRGAHSTLDLHDVLSQCAALIECSVVVRASLAEEIADHHHPPIILPHLLVLSIAPFYDDVDWDKFLHPFVLPSLEVLGCENWALEAFSALVSRSRCRLKELESFMEVSFSESIDVEGTCNLLRMVPSLVLLGNIPLPATVFNLVSRGELLPHVVTLNCSVEPDGLDAFLDLVEKSPPGQGIQAAHISLHHELNEGDEVGRRFISLCERFAAEGRDITMEVIAD